jgi:hypothetical protein
MNRCVLVLAHAADAGAASVAGRLASALGPERVRLMRPEALTLAKWTHRVTDRGQASTRLEAPGHAPLSSTDVGAVLNRIRYLPAPRFRRSPAKDRDYACAEQHALVASWLAGLGQRVVHGVRTHPWVTLWMPRQHWSHAAARCGLPVAHCVYNSAPRMRALAEPGRSEDDAALLEVTGTVLVAGETAGGDMADRFRPACIAMARALRLPLLECRFGLDRGEVALVHADPYPTLSEPWAASLTADLLRGIAMDTHP